MGQKAPERAGNPPDIEPSYQVWWTAWQDLTTDRPGGGLYSIPFSAMANYADRYGLDLELLKLIVWKLDGLFLERQRKRIKSQGSQGNG